MIGIDSDSYSNIAEVTYREERIAHWDGRAVKWTHTLNGGIISVEG
jgi:hypothetical protein